MSMGYEIDGSVYWQLMNDDAPFHCEECEIRDFAENLILIQTPDKSRLVLHKTCIDQDWLKNAKYMGTYQY